MSALRAVQLAVALSAGACCGSGLAQGVPLKPAEVTEAGIIDALAPGLASAADAASGPRARGLRPTIRAKAAPASGKASVLITFATDSALLTAESRAALDVVARALGDGRLARLAFSVEGHSDPRGEADHNMALSQARAEAVVAYLVDQQGVDRQRLVAVGKGAAEPLNTSVAAAPENRRVTFVRRD